MTKPAEEPSLLADILRTMHDGYWLVDKDGRIADVNEAYCRLSGYERLELIGKAVADIDLQDSPEGSAAFETAHRRKDGGAMDVAVSTAWSQSAGGMLVAFIRDITHSKTVVQVLRESHEKTNLLLNSTAEAIYGIDMDGNCTFCNDSCLRMLGYERAEDLLGRNMHERIHSKRPDGAPFPVEECRIYQAFKSGEPTHVDDEVLWRRDGTSFAAEYWSHPQKRDGAVVGAVVSFLDITERKKVAQALAESERRFMDVLYASSDAILLIDQETFVDCNQATASMLGYADREDFLRVHPSKLSPPDQPDGQPSFEKANEMMNLAFARGFHRFEWVHRKASGKHFPVEVSLTPVIFKGKSMLHCVWRDMTEQRRTQDELDRHRFHLEELVGERTLQLERAHKELESFSYSVSHDLRAPLRAMDGFSQALLDEYVSLLDDQGRDYLNRVRAASGRMAQLIDDLLKLARVSRASMKRRAVDLSALARACAQSLQKAEPSRRVEFSIAPGLSAEGDPALLEVVMTNLLENAWKFTAKKAAARIEFGAAASAGPDGAGAFFVRDDGAGFDMAYADKLFGSFQRLHNATDFPGTGIGLATVRRVIERHGGRVWAEGKTGEGAAFYFEL